MEILKKDKDRIVVEGRISIERIESISAELKKILDEPYEVTCCSCGSLIHANETKCPQCGWTWDSADKSLL